MSTTPARGTPEQPAVATVPAAAPAAPASSLQQPTFEQRVAAAKTPAELRAIKAEALPAMQHTLKTKPREFDGKQPTAETPAAPAEKPATTTEEATPATPEEPTAEETTEETTSAGENPETEQPGPAAEEESEPGEEDDGGDGPVEPISGKRTHLRLPKDDKVGRLAAALMKRNKDMGWEEATERARKELGIKNPSTTADEPATPESTLPKTVEETNAQIARLRDERRKANSEVRFEDASDLSNQIEDLIQHRFSLERQEEKRASSEEAAYNRDFSASEKRANELYEFAGKPESPGGKRMREIEAELKENEDPLYYSPNKPLKIAQMVAAELNIAPRKKGAPAAPVKAAAPAPGAPPAKKQILPGGGSKTTPPPINQPPAINAEVQKVQSPGEWRAFKKKHGLPV